MASKYWIKLYHEILEDPKMGNLPDNLWRRVIELFLLAGEIDQDGQLPSTAEIAWKLRHDAVTLRDELRTLTVTGITKSCDNDTWLIVNFAKRQAKVDDKERKRQQRKREKAPKYLSLLGDPAKNGAGKDVTKRDLDTDTDINPKGLGDKSPGEVEKLDGPRKQLMGIFNTVTNMQMPHRKTDVKFWWSSIGEIYKMAGCDVSLGEHLIRQSVERMREKRLDITSPNSIVGYCRSILAESSGGKPILSIAAK